ncbi:MAG: chemotaxis protein CheB [Ferruginibacter sp.]
MDTTGSQKIYELLLLGGSAGSLDSLLSITASLTRTDIAVIIVIHRKDDNDSTLADLVAVRTKLRVKEAEDKESILPGTIYIAPPDYHLLLESDRSLSLDVSEKIHFSRPCIDVTFETAADVYGNRTVAVLLSGANSDGADGLKKIQEAGGITIVVDPSTAIVHYMPQHALQTFIPAHIIAAGELAAFISEL